MIRATKAIINRYIRSSKLITARNIIGFAQNVSQKSPQFPSIKKMIYCDESYAQFKLPAQQSLLLWISPSIAMTFINFIQGWSLKNTVILGSMYYFGVLFFSLSQVLTAKRLLSWEIQKQNNKIINHYFTVPRNLFSKNYIELTGQSPTIPQCFEFLQPPQTIKARTAAGKVYKNNPLTKQYPYIDRNKNPQLAAVTQKLNQQALYLISTRTLRIKVRPDQIRSFNLLKNKIKRVEISQQTQIAKQMNSLKKQYFSMMIDYKLGSNYIQFIFSLNQDTDPVLKEQILAVMVGEKVEKSQ